MLRDAEFAGQKGDRLLAELRALRGDLVRIGNNLNQLAYAANSGKAVACAVTLDDIDALKDRTDPELSQRADRLCEELGADKISRALILHQKDGKRHGHLILPK
ncbi:plasmid mobilization relaxosome protein MobC [Acetobacter orientalis]|uniref:plasmid mobilization relaxosome protein MobC n=1 Tax=Acetobacter orientalis TaxID=146474 RepID=UPI0039EC25B3